MKLEPWEEPSDPSNDTPSDRAVRRIMEMAGGETIDRVIEAYRMRSQWLKNHPGDMAVLYVGSALARLLENRGGDVRDLPRLMNETPRPASLNDKLTV